MNGWEEIVGHEWAVAQLQASIAHSRVGHAYLFTGPSQVGKATLARVFAQALNCEAEEATARPCGHCRACRLIAAGRHPDVRLLEPEVSGRGKPTIKIEQVRQLLQDLVLAAYESPWKVVILAEFESATVGAANAFLKTLEEPPANVLLLLTAVDAEMLPATIRSRCRLLALRPLPQTLVAEALQQRWQVPAAEAARLAHMAEGKLGWAVEMARQPEKLAARADELAQLQAVLHGGLVERFAQAEELAQKPEMLPALLQTWLTWWRDLMLLLWGTREGDRAVSNIDQLPALRGYAADCPPQAVLHSLRQTGEALWQLDHNANARLALENLFLAYPAKE